jgi:hypothetical protein
LPTALNSIGPILRIFGQHDGEGRPNRSRSKLLPLHALLPPPLSGIPLQQARPAGLSFTQANDGFTAALAVPRRIGQ